MNREIEPPILRPAYAWPYAIAGSSYGRAGRITELEKKPRSFDYAQDDGARKKVPHPHISTSSMSGKGGA